MPHEHIQLAQAPNGELGPRCHECGIRLTFGNAWLSTNITCAGTIMLMQLVLVRKQRFRKQMSAFG